MKKYLVIFLSLVSLAFTGCSEDDGGAGAAAISVSFASPSVNVSGEQSPVTIVFSGAVGANGTVTVSYTGTNAVYGTDFTTSPAPVNGSFEVPFNSGDEATSFTFYKLVDAGEGETKNVVFTITGITINAAITGNALTQVNFDEAPSLGEALAPEVGGPNQPNQVYVDMSSGMMTVIPRVSWDLGFYCGDEFRIALNSSLKMSAKQLNTTNIDEVVSADPTMIINQGNGSASQIDHPSGDINQTVISAVSDDDAANKVYLINLGSGPAATEPAAGSEGSSAGPHRGWKKVRITKNGNGYRLQYADINATTHQEVTLAKDAAYNFVFFSFAANSAVQAEPQKHLWDMNFTTITNLIEAETGDLPYYFPDFIVTNTKGGARSYMVLTEDFSYEAFTLANVDQAKLAGTDQRNIGAEWRSTSVMGPGGFPVSQFVVKTDRFFVVKDPAGNIYKIKMTGGANQDGERGFPTFQYALLQ